MEEEEEEEEEEASGLVWDMDRTERARRRWWIEKEGALWPRVLTDGDRYGTARAHAARLQFAIRG